MYNRYIRGDGGTYTRISAEDAPLPPPENMEKAATAAITTTTAAPPIIRVFLGGAWKPFFSGSAFKAAPHLGQAAAPAGTDSPHLGQKDALDSLETPSADICAPHAPQKVAPSGTSFPHLGHIAIFILLLFHMGPSENMPLADRPEPNATLQHFRHKNNKLAA